MDDGDRDGDGEVVRDGDGDGVVGGVRDTNVEVDVDGEGGRGDMGPFCLFRLLLVADEDGMDAPPHPLRQIFCL